MNTHRTLSVLLLASGLTAAIGSVACDTETATTSVVDNAYPSFDGGAGGAGSQGEVVVYRAWWLTTYYSDPVAPGASSAKRRSVPGAETAYAVLAPGWDPSSAAPPSILIPVRSKTPLSIDRGDTLHVVVSDQTFTGNCASGQILAQADADFITQSIFPAEFAGRVYDAKTCTLSAAGPDAGDAGDAGDAADAGDSDSGAGDAATD